MALDYNAVSELFGVRIDLEHLLRHWIVHSDDGGWHLVEVGPQVNSNVLCDSWSWDEMLTWKHTILKNIPCVCACKAHDGLWLTQALIILKRLCRFTSNKNMA